MRKNEEQSNEWWQEDFEFAGFEIEFPQFDEMSDEIVFHAVFNPKRKNKKS